MELIKILIYTVVEENASSLNFDIAVDDEIPSTVSQNVKPIEVMQKVVLPEFSELNELVINNEKGYSKKKGLIPLSSHNNLPLDGSSYEAIDSSVLKNVF